jgi:hypothetical protein
MAANRVTVVPEDLIASGEQVSLHADELLATHTGDRLQGGVVAAAPTRCWSRRAGGEGR